MSDNSGDFKPTLPVMNALREGANSPQQDAFMRQQEAINQQMKLNDMKGGNKNMRGGTACPQLPTYGMAPSPMDGNAQSYKMNNLNAQSSADSAGDDMIGILPSSQKGGKRRRKRGKSSKRKSRNTKKRSRKMKRTRKTKTSKRRNKRTRARK